MPYSTLATLPDAVKKLPKHAQEIYQSAFNNAFKQYNGNEGRSHATAWAAVEKVYKKENGKWVAKESRRKSMNLSNENKKNLLQTALVAEYGIEKTTPKPGSITVEEVFDSEIIYNIDGQLYKASYEMDEDTPIIGTPQKVSATKVFTTKESLQTVYSEIFQEAGKRNASMDAARVKKIVALCQELLSSEAPDEEKTKEALIEAESVLTWIKEQAAMKTEDGVKFPAAAFAYTPEADKPSGWKLRLWEDLENKITRAQLGRAAAALSPGGFRGQKVQIPSADMAAVKRKIRAEYRKLNVEEDDIPRWVREAETRELIQSWVSLTEATFDKGRATVIVIKAGFNATEDRYYPADVLKRDYGIFEGMKMYADHPTEEEDKARPERSIKDWVGTLSEVKCDENGVVTGIAEIIEPWLMQKLASLREKEMLSEMGISINAIGSASKGTIDGKETLVIEKLVAARSVDFVTEPGAGGIVTFYESDRRYDIDLVELATLKEKRPDLVKIIEAKVREEITKEVRKAMDNEARITELEGENEALKTTNTGLNDKITLSEKAQAKAEAQAVIKEAVDKAELPEAAKERLIERFKDAESADGIVEAVQAEKDYIATLAEAGAVKKLGGSTPEPEKDRAKLKESFKKNYIAQGETEEQAEKLAETAVTGR